MAMLTRLGDALPPIAVSEPGVVKAYDHTCPPGQTNTETGCFDGAAHKAQNDMIEFGLIGLGAAILLFGNGPWRLAGIPIAGYGMAARVAGSIT